MTKRTRKYILEIFLTAIFFLLQLSGTVFAVEEIIGIEVEDIILDETDIQPPTMSAKVVFADVDKYEIKSIRWNANLEKLNDEDKKEIYPYTMILSAKDGYVFSDNLVVTLNRAGYNFDGGASITYNQEKTEIEVKAFAFMTKKELDVQNFIPNNNGKMDIDETAEKKELYVENPNYNKEPTIAEETTSKATLEVEDGKLVGNTSNQAESNVSVAAIVGIILGIGLIVAAIMAEKAAKKNKKRKV